MTNGIAIAAASSGSGKTTLTLGLLRALQRRGVDVCSAKSGPDYIDPAFHAAATGRACLTLDGWAAAPEQLRGRAASADGEILVVEGAMGLLDGAAGADPGGPGSVQHLADVLGIPVVLVIDAARMAQSVVAIAEGFAARSGRIAGVIFNRAGSARHAAMLRSAMPPDIPVLGCLPNDAALAMPSRHLGLVQAAEREDLEVFLELAADAVEANCDIGSIISRALPIPKNGDLRRLIPLGQRIAVACDLAFGFAYHHQLTDWQARGAEILPFSPLADEAPAPRADAIFLPGGYPELHAGKLAAGSCFQGGLRAASASGALIYGECGGYMVLGEGLVDAEGQRHAMAGLLPLETSFADRRRHLGYRRLLPRAGPWQCALKGHEFHYCSTVRADGPPLFDTADATGTDVGPMGLVHGSVMGSFAHIIEATAPLQQ